MTVFYFVRHGLTAHTGHRLSGWTSGLHLNDEGRDQAKVVARRLASAPIKAVYSSPIERTMETARPIAAEHKLDIKVRRALGEVNYGKWTNRSLKDLMRTKLWTTVQQWPSGVRFPGGETLREVQARALKETERLILEHRKQHVCCVTHAEIIRLVAAHYLGVPIDLFQRIVVDPGSITVIGVGERGPRVFAVNVIPEKS